MREKTKTITVKTKAVVARLRVAYMESMFDYSSMIINGMLIVIFLDSIWIALATPFFVGGFSFFSFLLLSYLFFLCFFFGFRNFAIQFFTKKKKYIEKNKKMENENKKVIK